MKKIALWRLFAVSSLSLVTAGSLAGCKLLLGEPSGGPSKEQQALIPKPLTIKTYTDTTPAGSVLGTGGTIWEGTTRGLLKWDTAKGTAQLISSADGLPGNRVIALALDGQNALWVVTAGGVAHQVQGKTGYTWKTYPAPSVGDVAGITTTVDGAAWIGGDKGLAKLNKKGAWEPYLGSTSITALVGAGNDVWVGTKKNGLAHIIADKKGDRVEAFGPAQGADVEKVTGLTATPGGVMAIGESKAGQRIAFFDGFRFWSYRVEGMEQKIEWLRRIGNDALVGSQNLIWTLKRAETPGSPAGIKMVTTTPGAPTPAPSGSAKSDPPNVIKSDDDKNATASAFAATPPAKAPAAGAAPATGAAPAAAPEKAPEVMSPGWEVARWGPNLPRENTTAIGPDGPTLFVGTRFQGVARVEPEATTAWRQYDLAADGDRLYVACDQPGDCFISTGQPRAFHLDANGFDLADIDSEQGSTIMAVLSPPNGGPLSLGRGLKDNGLRVSQLAGDKWIPVILRDLAVPNGAVPDVTFASFSGSRLWLGLRYIDKDGDATDYGAAEVDLTKDDVKFHRTIGVMGQKTEAMLWPLPNDLTVAYFRNATESWFGTRTGMVRVKGGESRVFGEAEGIQSETVRDFVDGPDKKLWAATAHGVATWDEKKWTYPAADDPLHGKATGLVKDKFGWVWVATSSGLYLCGPPDPNTAERYSLIKIDAKRGLADDKMIDIALDKLGRIWVLTEKGLSVLER